MKKVYVDTITACKWCPAHKYHMSSEKSIYECGYKRNERGYIVHVKIKEPYEVLEKGFPRCCPLETEVQNDD